MQRLTLAALAAILLAGCGTTVRTTQTTPVITEEEAEGMSGLADEALIEPAP